MASFDFDEQDFPLVRVRYPAEIDDVAVEGYLAKMLARIQRGKPFAMLVDLRTAGKLNVVHRKAIADFMGAHDFQLRKLVRAVASVVTTVEVKHATKALSFIAPPPYPRQEFAAYEEAEAWVRGHLSSTARSA